MPKVTVSPINTINVRVNSQNQQVVRSTSTFVGSSINILEETIVLAEQAIATANIAYAESYLAYGLAANSLPLTGGTITGQLDVTGNVITQSDFIGIIDAGIF
jgi:alpha-D-ribose 1-methylphosphonate 5-phosphate C-P lyase